ncbi:MAG: Fe-S-containing protein [ANME-2 cluster archaeon]|nr:Fe-S-containing protein [ANME-2 cluster archaeon]
MLETLTITLREGIEAALVVGIILAYLGRTNKPELKKYVYGGIAAAVAGSIATAAAIQMLMAEWSEFMEGLMFFTAAFFIATMLIWMHHASKHIKQNIEQDVEKAFGKWQAAGILALSFFMIFREGAEIVLFLSATAKEASLAVALEGAAGLALAILFGYMFVKGSMRIDLGKFFRVTGAMLSVIIFQLIIGGIHEWSEVGIINLSQTGMKIIGPLVRETASIVYTGIMLGFLVLLFVMIPWKQTGDLKGIEKRKALGSARKDRNRRIITGIVSGLFILIFVSSQISALPQGFDPVPEKVSTAGGEIRIPAAADGNLHKYECDMQHEGEYCPMNGSSGDANIRIMAVRKSDGSTAVAYDACALCGAAGYVQEGDELICKRCGAPINPDTVGAGGGCNPIPIEHTLEDSEIVIDLNDLEEDKTGLFEK